MDNRPIGVFDSGVGAFSCLHQLVEVLPHEDFIFFADSGHNPYGQKSEEQLHILADVIGEFLMEHNVKAIVIACNTMCAASLTYMRERFDVPIFGVIEAGASDAINKTKNKVIGVCATAYTVESHAYKNKINELVNHDESYVVNEVECLGLAAGIERGKDVEPIIEDALSNFKKADTLILGCTHYPLKRNIFEEYFKGSYVVDPAKLTALNVKEYLEQYNLLNDSKEPYRLECYVTKDPNAFKEVKQKISHLPLDFVKRVYIKDALEELDFFDQTNE